MNIDAAREYLESMPGRQASLADIARACGKRIPDVMPDVAPRSVFTFVDELQNVGIEQCEHARGVDTLFVLRTNAEIDSERDEQRLTTQLSRVRSEVDDLSMAAQ